MLRMTSERQMQNDVCLCFIDYVKTLHKVRDKEPSEIRGEFYLFLSLLTPKYLLIFSANVTNLTEIRTRFSTRSNRLHVDRK